MQITVESASARRVRTTAQSIGITALVVAFVVFSLVALGAGVARHSSVPTNVTSEVGGNFVPARGADYHSGAELPVPPVKMPNS